MIDSTMRQDEVFCREVFNQFIRQQLPAAEIEWQDGNQNVAPDFHLRINDSQFVVEVTTIVEMVEVADGDGTRYLPRRTIDMARQDFIRDLNEQLSSSASVHGRYYVSFPPFNPWTNFPKEKSVIADRIINLIAQTRDVESFQSREITINNKLYCSVTKTGLDGDFVQLGILPITGEFGEKSKSNACERLQRVISTKRRVLADLDAPPILLILAQYPFVEFQYYNRCTDDLQEVEDYHTVFMVNAYRGELQGYTLFSEEELLRGMLRTENVNN